MKLSIISAFLVNVITVVTSNEKGIHQRAVRKLQKSSTSKSSQTKCPDVCASKEIPVDVGSSFTSVVITKDFVLNDEALVNAQFLKIDTDNDGITDGIEGFASFIFLNEEATEGQAVTVQSAFENEEINIIAMGAYLRIKYFDSDDPIFTLFNSKHPNGVVLPLDVVGSLINGGLNNSGLGNPSQFLLFKALELFVDYVFDIVLVEERRKLEFTGDMEGRRLGSSCNAWNKLWFATKIVASCGVSSVAGVVGCISTVVGLPVCLGLAATAVGVGCASTIANGCS